jgi:hypothetical protein
MKKTLFTLLILSLFALSACTAAPTPATTQAPAATQPPAGQGNTPTTSPPAAATTAPVAYPTPPTGVPYPTAQQAVVPPYPNYPAQQQPYTAPATLQPSPTFDATMGNVTGKILLNGQPVVASLFLAKIGADAKGTELVASFSAGESPRVEIDPQGNFVFVNIPAGRYALVIYTGVSGFLATLPGKEEAVTMTVDAGKTTDLGTMDYKELPLPVVSTPKP